MYYNENINIKYKILYTSHVEYIFKYPVLMLLKCIFKYLFIFSGTYLRLGLILMF